MQPYLKPHKWTWSELECTWTLFKCHATALKIHLSALECTWVKALALKCTEVHSSCTQRFRRGGSLPSHYCSSRWLNEHRRLAKDTSDPMPLLSRELQQEIRTLTYGSLSIFICSQNYCTRVSIPTFTGLILDLSSLNGLCFWVITQCITSQARVATDHRPFFIPLSLMPPAPNLHGKRDLHSKPHLYYARKI